MLRTLLKDRFFCSILLLNFLLRLVLSIHVVTHHFWVSGDSGHYFYFAEKLCNGMWGGEPFRGPVYLQFLCLGSLGKVARTAGVNTGSGVELVIFLQNAIMIASGILIYLKTKSKALSSFWLYNPVLFIFSFLIMSDQLFGNIVLVCFLLLQTFLALKRSRKNGLLISAFTGISFGIAVLTRNIFLPCLVVLVPFAIYSIIRGQRFKNWIAVFLFAFMTILPRLVWNYQIEKKVFLFEQNTSWFSTIVAAVEYNDLGFFDAEEKWVKERPHIQGVDSLQILKDKFPTYVALVGKGLIRTFFGHANVEWAYVFTGKTIQGPGWFKNVEHGLGKAMHGRDVILWFLGVLAFLIYHFCFYFYFIKESLKRFRRKKIREKDVFILSYSGICIFLLAFSPQIFGDARFGIPVFAVMISILTYYKTAKKVT